MPATIIDFRTAARRIALLRLARAITDKQPPPRAA